MKILNAIVTGPPGSGKSALIKVLSEHVYETPETVASEKKGDAYSIEFGRNRVDEDTFLYLAGVPSDESMHFVWERLADGLLGFVVVFDAVSESHKAEAKSLIERLKKFPDTPCVVVLNRLVERDDPKADRLKKELGIAREEQLVCADVADAAQAKTVLLRLLNIGMKQIKKLSA